ncbi:hypothetical protein G6N74_16400 [Mesorhizobium sp. CGMCC 1.15528]|uniref:Uncharacterized protein n=1 Tax=Mesorhizobium zhangyense TaxID=1776730 RepID=A0A7C9VED9_9HYPH|nr:hypothetical protein [Mesorhizobium zhangyense]NGN42651.1 hypothetical protein [Mesorhizobium zhangyense]
MDIVDEMLGMARDPATFTKDDLAEMVMLAATEIIKLRQFPPIWVKQAQLNGARRVKRAASRKDMAGDGQRLR